MKLKSFASVFILMLFVAIVGFAATNSGQFSALIKKQKTDVVKVKTFEGELESVTFESVDKEGNIEPEKSETVFYLNQKGESYVIDSEMEELAYLEGSIVRLKGILKGNVIYLDSGDKKNKNNNIDSVLKIVKLKEDPIFEYDGPNFEVKDKDEFNEKILDTLGYRRTGDEKLAIIKMDFPRIPFSGFPSNEELANQFFHNSDSISKFFEDSSYGRMKFVGDESDIYGEYLLQSSYENCRQNSSNWREEALSQASLSGFEMEDYDVVLYLLPFIEGYDAGCVANGWAGDDFAWVLFAEGYDFHYQVAIHELGHAIGLKHASSYECFDEEGELITIGERCRFIEYGDWLGVMGSSTFRSHFNNFHKSQLGWIDRDETLEVSETGIYTLNSLEDPDSEIKSIRIKRNYDDFYYLEYRRPIGFDESLTPIDLDGVIVRSAPDAFSVSHLIESDRSRVFDMTPGNRVGPITEFPLRNPVLPIGEVFEDDKRGIKITPLSADDRGLQVQIEIQEDREEFANLKLRIMRIVEGLPESLSDDNVRITSEPPGIDCPDFCQYSFPRGTEVTLNVTNLPENLNFQSWRSHWGFKTTWQTWQLFERYCEEGEENNSMTCTISLDDRITTFAYFE